VTTEPQAGVGTSSLMHFTNISDMFRTSLSDHLEVHRHNNVRQSQYLRNFYYVRVTVWSQFLVGYSHQNMLHKIVKYVTPPFVGLLRPHNQSHENVLILMWNTSMVSLDGGVCRQSR